MKQDKHMNSELENAFNKELNIIKNDLYYQQLEFERENKERLVRFDISYTPLEILSGDSYSIRKNHDGKIVFFLIDAMGKGVSASITATTSTSLLNYIFDQMQRTENFEFERWIQRYLDFIKNELLDNEMIAILFGMYERENAKCTYASFGMPAVLAKSKGGHLHKVKSNNMPINQYTDDFETDVLRASGIEKLLIYTDGLCESKMPSGEFYKNQMYQDFLDSECISDFSQMVKEKLPQNQDDTAFFYINTVNLGVDWKKERIRGTREDIENVLSSIREYLNEFGAKPKESSEVILAMSEILLNASEHGIHGIDKEKKSKLIERGEFDDLLDELEKRDSDKYIDIQYFIKETKRGKMFILKVSDYGAGFDVRTLRQLVVNPKSFNGRGIMIIKKLLDRFYYNEKGNSITARKMISAL